MFSLSEEAYLQFVWALATYQIVISKLLVAIVILLLGTILAWLFFVLVRWIFSKLRIQAYLQKIFQWGSTNLGNQDIGTIVAKSIGAFVFILVLRKVVVYLGFNEVEKFLTDLIDYLPSLFIAVLIGFFGIRFSRTMHDIVLRAFRFSDPGMSAALANMAKWILLFFTFIIVLHYSRIVNDFIINSVLIGFISMFSLAWGIAFGLGGKNLAEETLTGMKNRSSGMTGEEKTLGGTSIR